MEDRVKLSNEYNRPDKKSSAIPVILLGTTLAFFILLLVLYFNKDAFVKYKKTDTQNSDINNSEEESKKTAEEIWADVTKDPRVEEETVLDEGEQNNSEEKVDEKDTIPEEETEEFQKSHTLITYADGKTEWFSINKYITKNNYDLSCIEYKAPFQQYLEQNKVESFSGIIVDKSFGMIDYHKVKKAGVDFVMIKIGQRGYQTGILQLDDYFATNMKNAKDAGLYIGIYFESYAVDLNEANEEAEFVLKYLEDYSINYPVVFVTKDAPEGEARTDTIGKVARTDIAVTFLDKIKEKGYIPMLQGDKPWLLKKYKADILDDYDVWYTQCSTLPDYPYTYSMWQYSTGSTISGVSGSVGLLMSFVDFSIK